nr:transposase family protein [Saccharopolyspora sp. HNM0983]
MLPHLAGAVIEGIERMPAGVRVWARVDANGASCWSCGTPAVHSRYERTLADLPVAGQPVALRLRVRRFFCDDRTCSVRTFAEQVEGLTTRHAQRSSPCRESLAQVGLALAGRAGARLAGLLEMPASRGTVLRLVHALPEPAIEPGTVLGVDDFALARRQQYATVIIDAVSHRRIDVLPVTEDGVPEVARRARLGQKMKGIARVYDHVTPAMREQISEALEARWNRGLAVINDTERGWLEQHTPWLKLP